MTEIIRSEIGQGAHKKTETMLNAGTFEISVQREISNQSYQCSEIDENLADNPFSSEIRPRFSSRPSIDGLICIGGVHIERNGRETAFFAARRRRASRANHRAGNPWRALPVNVQPGVFLRAVNLREFPCHWPVSLRTTSPTVSADQHFYLGVFVGKLRYEATSRDMRCYCLRTRTNQNSLTAD